MALFAYKAIDTRGKTMLGQIEAINLVDLELRLKRMGLDLVRGGPTRHGGGPFPAGENKGAERIKLCFHSGHPLAPRARPRQSPSAPRPKRDKLPSYARHHG